jgi:hypothetical protein
VEREEEVGGGLSLSGGAAADPGPQRPSGCPTRRLGRCPSRRRRLGLGRPGQWGLGWPGRPGIPHPGRACMASLTRRDLTPLARAPCPCWPRAGIARPGRAEIGRAGPGSARGDARRMRPLERPALPCGPGRFADCMARCPASLGRGPGSTGLRCRRGPRGCGSARRRGAGERQRGRARHAARRPPLDVRVSSKSPAARSPRRGTGPLRSEPPPTT